jgi:hypothetical protein
LAALFSAASDWLVTASRTVARTTGLAATGVTAATYPLVLSTVPRSHAPVTAAGSSMTNAVASPAASARRVLPWRAAAGRPGRLGRVLATAVSMPRFMWPSLPFAAWLCAREKAGRGIRFGGPAEFGLGGLARFCRFFSAAFQVEAREYPVEGGGQHQQP